MLTRKRSSSHRAAPWIGLLALGVAAGWLLRDGLATRAWARACRLVYYGGSQHGARAVEPGAAAVELPKLALEIAPEHLIALEHERDQALARRILLDEQSIRVPARLSFDGGTSAAQVALKGDLLDHLDTDQWSLRIELTDAPWLGMSAFSIQHPKTRQLSAEWLVLEAARREGLLAPRVGLVEVAINARPARTYVFEQHFTRELLESQGRRDGPIVRFDESTLWSTRRDAHGSGPTATNARAFTPIAAQIDTFGAQRLAKLDELERTWQAAIERMGRLRELADGLEDASRVSRDSLRATAIDSLIDIDATARAHALLTFFGCPHGLYWPNLRFYANELTDRLEPLLYDVGQRGGDFDPYEIAGTPYRDFLASPRYERALFEHLARFARAAYVDELQDALDVEYVRLAQALDERGYAVSRRSSAKLWDELRERQIAIADLVQPRDPVNWVCELATAADGSATLTIEAWCTTRVPVVVESFEGLGFAVSAASVAARGAARDLDCGGGAVMLSGDGRHARFELGVSSPRAEALAALFAVSDGSKASKRARIEVHYRTVGQRASAVEHLVPSRADATRDLDSGRRAPPSLDEALARHDCLAYDVDRDRLYVRAGTWSVESDLALPEGRALELEAGATLRFAANAALIATGALVFEGDEEHGIVLEPIDADAGWPGVVVLAAAQTSRWHFVDVRGTRALERGAWRTSGGVTFHGGVLELQHCRFQDAHCEDALNVVRTSIAIEDTLFERCTSDALDCDSTSGSISRCTFRGVAGDGIDLSGGRIRIESCSLSEIGDKGVSIGEASRAELRSCEIRSAKIGVACKDASRAEVADLVVGRVTLCALAAYVKKPEFGPSSMHVTHLTFEPGAGRMARAATGCELTIDGTAVQTEDLGVDDF